MYLTPHRALVPVLFAALALLGASVAEARPTPPKNLDTQVKGTQTFRYRYKTGGADQYTTVMAQSIKMDAGAGAPPMDSTSTIKTTLQQKVESVDPDGTATLTTTYEGLKIEIVQNGARIPADQVGPLEDALKGITSRTRLTARGEPRDLTVDGEPVAMKQITESMKSAMVGTNPIFPDRAIKVGESWTQKIPIAINQGPLKLTLHFQVTYTYIGASKLKDATASVFRVDVESSMNESPAGPGGARIVMTGNGEGVGFIYFNNEQGKLVRSELEMTQTTHMKIDAGQGSNAIKMGQTTSATMELK
jgi:hypothetical protein